MSNYCYKYLPPHLQLNNYQSYHLVCKLFKTNMGKIGCIPSVAITTVRPFAHHCAERARIVARCTIAEKVGQVKELPRSLERVRFALFQPQQLGSLHFW